MIKKRGASYKGIGLYVGTDIPELDTDTKQKPRRRKHTILKVALFLVLVAVTAIGIAWTISYLADKREQQRKEDLVWQAIYELIVVESDKTVNYLRLQDVKHEDGHLKLVFLAHIPEIIHTVWVDSTMLSAFSTIVAINQEPWAKVADCLNEAETDIELLYIDRGDAFSLTIHHKKLLEIVSNKQVMESATSKFAKLKSLEILDYARQHFKGDHYLFVDSTSLTKDYICLNLSFDDSKYYLGESYLDTMRVNSHFTDKIGDLGSILDGMLSICSRTDRGFAFVYRGKKKNTVHRIEWNRDRTRQLSEEYPGIIWHHGRKTNQVKTVVTSSSK